MLLPGAAETEVLEIAERIRDRLCNLSVAVGTSDLRNALITGVPASFGAAVYPDVATTMDQLILAADDALQLLQDLVGMLARHTAHRGQRPRRRLGRPPRLGEGLRRRR